MNRTARIGLSLLAVCAVGVMLYVTLRPIPAKAPESGGGKNVVANPYVEHGAYYDITAAYPTSTSLTTSANEAAIAAMQGFVIEVISTFKDAAEKAGAAEAKSTLDITYTHTATPAEVSYVFTINERVGRAVTTTIMRAFDFNI